MQSQSEPFAARVQRLHEGWAERRELENLSGSHDQESQYALLLTLHAWAVECVADIRRVYAGVLPVTVGPVPRRDAEPPGFILSIGRGMRLVFTLSRRRGLDDSPWTVAAAMETLGEHHRSDPLGPDRRSGRWTRQRLEDLLLTALGAYERSLGRETIKPPGGRGRAGSGQ